MVAPTEAATANIADVQTTKRGHHKVFLGMAAGVGKTYQMLREGQTEAENGHDVGIGYLEPHGRADTAAQAEGLSAQQIVGRLLEEMAAEK